MRTLLLVVLLSAAPVPAAEFSAGGDLSVLQIAEPSGSFSAHPLAGLRGAIHLNDWLHVAASYGATYRFEGARFSTTGWHHRLVLTPEFFVPVGDPRLVAGVGLAGLLVSNTFFDRGVAYSSATQLGIGPHFLLGLEVPLDSVSVRFAGTVLYARQRFELTFGIAVTTGGRP
jgi:hypothetical protein